MTTRKSLNRGGSGTAWRISSGPARPDTSGAAGRRGGTGGVQLGWSLLSLVLRQQYQQYGFGGREHREHREDRGDRRCDGADQQQRLHPLLVRPRHPTTSKCNGTCAQNWPPVMGPVTGVGLTGTFGTIKRSDGSVQATFDGHPLYTFVGDTAPGPNRGNGLNAASANTIRTHLRYLDQKLGAHSRHDAVQRARASGLLAASSRTPYMPIGGTVMAYGHAERNLALIRQLEAETKQLLESLNQPDAEQSAGLQDSRLASPLGLPAEREWRTTRDDQRI